MATQNLVDANGSIDIAMQTMLLGMEAWILQCKQKALQWGHYIAMK
jgi:hypothetical protein